MTIRAFSSGRFWTKTFSVLEAKTLSYIRKNSRREFLDFQVDITNHCNLQCAHCYHPHHNNDGALSQDEWFQVIDAYKNLLNKLKRAPSFVICGGEPTTSPMLIPILKFIREKFGNCPISILTNGTTLRPTLVARLAPWAPNFQISIDGACEASHDAVRGNGNFSKALKGMENLRAAGLRFSVLTVLSRRTAKEIPDFFALARSLNTTNLNFVRLVTEGAGKELVSKGADAPLYGAELKNALEQIVSYSKKNGRFYEYKQATVCSPWRKSGSALPFSVAGCRLPRRIKGFKPNICRMRSRASRRTRKSLFKPSSIACASRVKNRVLWRLPFAREMRG